MLTANPATRLREGDGLQLCRSLSATGSVSRACAIDGMRRGTVPVIVVMHGVPRAIAAAWIS